MKDSLMKNPWEEICLQKGTYVLQQDYPELQKFNDRLADHSERKIHFEYLPEPFLGDPDAPIVLLNLNPGYDVSDLVWHNKQLFRELSCRNLRHEKTEYPFYLLDPRLEGSGGSSWWKAKLREPIESTSLQKVANNFFCIELFGYHSKKYGFNNRFIDSQRYALELLRKILADEDKLIIGMRSKRLWENALKQDENVVPKRFEDIPFLKSPQNPCISRNNCPNGIFDKILALLSEKTKN